jgi:glyoxylate reductase
MGCVLVAQELTPVWDAPTDWPGGHQTRLLPAGAQLPESEEIVALIPTLGHAIGAPHLDGLPQLRVIANFAVGYDNIDLVAAAERGVIVTNTPDVLTGATADLAWALLLAAARRLREGLELAASGGWSGWEVDQLLGMELDGKTLGVLGAGRIGVAMARRAPGFGVHLLYWNRSPSADMEALGARRAGSLEQLLSESDVVSIHLPLVEETHGLLGPAELALMRPNSILVNTARGDIVDTQALVAALRAGRPAAAGLDVYADEPEIPRDLRELDNAFVLPHLGSATREARRGMWRLAADNVRRVLAGDAPLTPVTPI